MSLTSQPGAYTDCYTLYERAIESNGMRVPFPDESSARYFQMRMNQARVIRRNESRRIYPPDNHLYNTSEFDTLKVQVLPDTEGEWWVYVRPHGEWDALSQAEPIPEQELLPPAHQRQPLRLTLESTPNGNEPTDLD